MFVETVPLGQLTDRGLLRELASSVDGLVVAVRPDSGAWRPAADAVRAAGLHFCAWPMLSDAAGRWCAAHNAPAFAAWGREIASALQPGDGFLFDLEPTFALLDAAAHGRWRGALAAWWGARSTADATPLAALVAQLLEREISVQTAEFPWPSPRWSRWAGVPELESLGAPPRGAFLCEPGEQPVARGVMLYTSMLEGYAAPWIDRGRARLLLRRWGRRALSRWGSATELQLGAIGTGALQHEPIYRAVHELREDLDDALALGASRVAVFELGGMLRRGAAKTSAEWFETCARARDLLRSRVAG